MQDITATILKVERRTTKNGKTVFDVALSDGQSYVTFQQPIADAAQGYVGQTVTARVNVSQNGQYTNRYFEGVVNAQGPPAQPQAIPAAPPQQQGGRSPEVEGRIVRQSSLATAFKFVGHIYAGAGPEALGEAKNYALGLARELFAEAFGTSDAKGAVIPQNGSEVAAQVNQVLEGAVSVGATTPTPDW